MIKQTKNSPIHAVGQQLVDVIENGVEIAFFAPYNDEVQILGSWNNFVAEKMIKGIDGWWRIHVPLEDGEYHYRFQVKSKSFFAMDEQVEVIDPYAIQVTPTDPENAVLRIKDGKRVWLDYQWQHDDVSLPTNDKLMIYELHVGDFSGTKEAVGTFNGVTAKLDYIKKLGMNAIELLPVKEFPGRGWGYCLKSLFAVENGYGTPEDLCRLIDEAHARGMRVIIDGVYNHAHSDSPLAKINYEYWFHKDNPDGPDMDWGPKFNYTHFDQNLGVFPARKYVIESINFWIEKFHIDGIRFDATSAIRNFDVMKEITDAAFAKVGDLKPFITIAEHIPEDPTITGRERGSPMDAAWHDWLGRTLQAVVSRTEQAGNHPDDVKNLIERLNPSTNRYEAAHRVVNFIGNHDYRRPMMIIGEDGKIFGEAAFRRMKLGTAILMAAPGLPMIWMGQEFGFASDKSLDPRPLDWSLISNNDNADLLAFHEKLLALRRDSDALNGPNFQPILVDDHRGVIAFKRWSDGGDVVVFVADIHDEEAGEVILRNAGLEDGTWKDWMNDTEIQVTGGEIKLNLERSGFRFLRKI